MRLRVKVAIVGAVAAALLSAMGMAVASGSSTGEPVQPVNAASALAAFRNQSDVTPSEAAGRISLRNEVVRPDDESLPLGQADYRLARSSSVPGSDATVWIVPSGEEVCTIIITPEDTQGGPWSAGCETVAEVNEGDGYTETTSPRGPTIIADVTADGAPGPRVLTGQTTEVLTPKGNVAAAVLSRLDSVEGPNGPISLKP